MNNRHIQTFLTVSAAFFAMSAPLHSNASVRTPANVAGRTVQHVVTSKSGTASHITRRSERDA
ncbi:MAG TPA: hypothetical protein VL689_07995 [Paraburkholderia sp.]|jgi:hypothetical protein|nr:hypothetical protein [Paraburkholderia sp.]